jgi:hypothetical protein
MGEEGLQLNSWWRLVAVAAGLETASREEKDC